jgi:hypothetical protein
MILISKNDNQFFNIVFIICDAKCMSMYQLPFEGAFKLAFFYHKSKNLAKIRIQNGVIVVTLDYERSNVNP